MSGQDRGQENAQADKNTGNDQGNQGQPQTPNEQGQGDGSVPNQAE